MGYRARFGENMCAMEIPQGNTREDIKARRQIIKDFYAQWIAAHPEKRVWNKSLKAYIYVKFQSINETLGHAPVSYESTKAVLNLTDLLSMAVKAKSKKAKTNDKRRKTDSRKAKNHRRVCPILCYKKRKVAWDATLRARIKLP